MKIGPDRFDYQKVGTEFLLQRALKKQSSLLCDEPGLGKTVQLIDLIDSLGVDKVVIVVPNSLKGNWYREFQTFHRGLEVTILRGGIEEREKIIREFSGVLLMNYEVLHKHQDALIKKKLDVLIFDESHRLKNRQAKVTKAAQKISRASSVKVFMSGTPVTRSVIDLWPILNMIAPKIYGSYWKYVETYTNVKHNGFAWEPYEITDENDTRLVSLRKQLSEMFIRRELSEVNPDFVSLSHLTRLVDIPPDQFSIYKKLAKDSLAEIDGEEILAVNALVLLTRLKQCLLDPRLTTGKEIPYLKGAKVDALLGLLEETGEEPFVVFTQFASAIAPLIKTLEREGVSAVEYSGQISQEHCDVNERIWKEGGVRVLIASIDKGGVGHTWTRAAYGVFLDKKYLPYENEQARKRLHRISQERPVVIWDLITTGTVEDRIERVLKEREEVFDRVITKTMLLRLIQGEK